LGLSKADKTVSRLGGLKVEMLGESLDLIGGQLLGWLMENFLVELLGQSSAERLAEQMESNLVTHSVRD
jgi:hypothetical protein